MRIFREQDRQSHCPEAFTGIANEDWISISFAERPRYIRRSDVTASDGANVHTGEPCDQPSERDRSEQVASHYDDYERQHATRSRYRFVCKSNRESQIDIIEISVGVIPLMRAAWPIQVGLIVSNF